MPKAVHSRADSDSRQRLVVDHWRSVDRHPHNNVLSRRVRGGALQGCDVVRWAKLGQLLGSHVWGQRCWTMEEQMSFAPSKAATQDHLVDRLVSKPRGAGRIWSVC